MTVVFVHGAGSPGPQAWPRQAARGEDGWVFLTRDVDGDDAARDARRVLDRLRPEGGGHVVAHSYGANAALRTDTVASVRTLVVTGGWSPLYEETAQALVDAGARHHVVAGAGHRPQDTPEADRVLRTFWG